MLTIRVDVFCLGFDPVRVGLLLGRLNVIIWLGQGCVWGLDMYLLDDVRMGRLCSFRFL